MSAVIPSASAEPDPLTREASFESLSDDDLRAEIVRLEAELHRRLRETLATKQTFFADTKVVENASRLRLLINRLRERLGELPFWVTSPDVLMRARFESALSDRWTQVREVLRLQPVSSAHELPPGDH